MGSDIDVTGRWNASRPSSTSVALRRPPIDLRPHSAIDACFPPCVVCETVAEHSFVSRRDNTFREFPPASAQLAMVVAFYGDLTVWIRKADAAGWHFPTSGRKSGETILEVAKRELWESARIVPPRLDLLGAMRYAGIGSPGHGVATKNTTAYVYMCEVSHLSWWYDAPEKEKVTEVGVFRTLPDPIASDSVELVHEAARRARRTGLR